MYLRTKEETFMFTMTRIKFLSLALLVYTAQVIFFVRAGVNSISDQNYAVSSRQDNVENIVFPTTLPIKALRSSSLDGRPNEDDIEKTSQAIQNSVTYERCIYLLEKEFSSYSCKLRINNVCTAILGGNGSTEDVKKIPTIGERNESSDTDLSLTKEANLIDQPDKEMKSNEYTQNFQVLDEPFKLMNHFLLNHGQSKRRRGRALLNLVLYPLSFYKNNAQDYKNKSQRILNENNEIDLGGNEDNKDLYNLFSAIGCVVMAAIAAGLTIGLMSLDPMHLEIKKRSGTREEREQAEKILPLIQKHHFLLVTLLIYNAGANEALPVFLGKLVSEEFAILISVTMVLFFGEILPSAIFSGPNQLKIAARLTPFVWFIMFLLFPIAWPISWVLDKSLGDAASHSKRYNRSELSALIEIHEDLRQRIKRRKPATANQQHQHTLTNKYVAVSRDNTTGHLFTSNDSSLSSDDIKPSLFQRFFNSKKESKSDQRGNYFPLKGDSLTDQGGSVDYENSIDPDDNGPDNPYIVQTMNSVNATDENEEERQYTVFHENSYDPVEPLDSNVTSNSLVFDKQTTSKVNIVQDTVKNVKDGHVISLESSIDQLVDIQKSGKQNSLIAFEKDENGKDNEHEEELLSRDEVDIVLGVLKVATKTVKDAMVPIDEVFCLSTDDELDDKLLTIIEAVGYSRIPVYKGKIKAAIVGFILVKNLITYDARQKPRKSVGKIPLRQPIVVSPMCPLIDILNVFQEGRSHMAIVAEDPHGFFNYTDRLKKRSSSKQKGSDMSLSFQESCRPIGIITLEDVIEEILQEEIIDENDRTKELIEKRRIGNAKQVLTASYIKKFGHERDFPLIDQLTVDLAIHNYEKQLANGNAKAQTPSKIGNSSSGHISSSPKDENENVRRALSPSLDSNVSGRLSTPNRLVETNVASDVSMKSPLLNQDSPSYGGMK